MTNISIDNESLAAFCRNWKVSELAVFGSVLREDFRPESDIDVLVTFLPDAGHGLFALNRMQEELKRLFGRDVDLVVRAAVEQSRNYIRRKEILSTMKVIHATR